MNHFDIQETLATFRIIVDTREQGTSKASGRFKSFGVPYERATLNYGDYAANITLQGNIPLCDISETVFAKCVIERKMSLDELAMCFTRRGRSRFQREMERAAEHGATVYLLIENGNYESIINHRYRSRFNPTAFLASLTAWMVRYNLRPVFCRSDTSGRLIKEILYRDIKERLERGEFD